MRRSGCTRKEIAEHLGRCPSTIGRELTRNSSRHDNYQPIQADSLALKRRRQPSVVSKLERLPELFSVVRDKLLLCWSPEQISGWLKSTKSDHQFSNKTIYKFLSRLDRKDPLRQSMRRKGRRNRRRKPGYIRSQLRDSVSIHNRPKLVQKRKRIGDWELDLVRCHRASGYLITAVDRMTGYTLVRKVASKSGALVMRGILKMFSSIDQAKIKTFTFDNGTEFFFHRWLTDALPVKV